MGGRNALLAGGSDPRYGLLHLPYAAFTTLHVAQHTLLFVTGLMS